MRSTKILPLKRRRAGNTNYKRRLKLLKSKKFRVVIRKSNNYITLQLVNFDMENFKEISATHEFILVEGAGGLLAPLSRDFLILDLIKLLQLPSLIVSRADLGTINHTLLTLRCLQTEKLPVAGIVINNLSPAKSLAAKTNPEIIAKLTKVPIWGILPYQNEIRSDKSIEKTVIKLIKEHLDLTPLFNLAKNKQKIIE